jgi:hypothetical protein
MNLDQFRTLEQLAEAIKSLNMVTVVNWTDYSATSTITGWSSYTTKSIFYARDVKKRVYVQFHIRGTSDTQTVQFTLPYSQQSDVSLHTAIHVRDNDAWQAGMGYALLGAGGSTVTCYLTGVGGASSWTASGNKAVVGQFWYET